RSADFQKQDRRSSRKDTMPLRTCPRRQAACPRGPRKGALSREDVAMRSIWRKCLGLSVSVLLGPAQAIEAAEPADASPPIIASSQSSTPAVSLGRPRFVPAPSAGIRQASFREEVPDTGLAIARAGTVEPQPMPAGP